MNEPLANLVHAEFVQAPRFLELLQVLKQKFPDLTYGQQCDDWIWIQDGTQKVAIDTFTSILMQVKADSQSVELLSKVIPVITKHYKLRMIDPPISES